MRKIREPIHKWKKRGEPGDLDFPKINEFFKKKFQNIPFEERALFLPQCLRDRNCEAKTTKENGIECEYDKCKNKCTLGHLKKESERLKYSVFIVPGSSYIKTMMENNGSKIKGALGVACGNELAIGYNIMRKAGIVPQSIQLLKEGCVDTTVDWKELGKKIHYTNGFSVEEK